MSVKIGKLWKKSQFKNLDRLSKLLYIYLATHPDLNTVGVCSPDLEVTSIEIGCNIQELRTATKELVNSNFVHVKQMEGVIYFIVPQHFNTIPKSNSSVLKIKKDLEPLPKALVKFLEKKQIKVESKVREFKKPTPKEVAEYGLSKGYIVDGQKFVDFYEDSTRRYGVKNGWVDSRNKQVRDWKSKLRGVWFKDENKIKSLPDAPKGFENFYAIHEGVPIFPDKWKNGKPFSKSLVIKKQLQEEYERRKKDS